MLSKRIIPCLDILEGATVKGIHFENLQSVGDPVTLGAKYAAEGADELVYLDIAATHEGRKTFTELVTRVARAINIPFTVGGGISAVADVERLLLAGADKVSVNSAAVRNPNVLDEMAEQFGSQCIVCAIDIGLIAGSWYVYINGGRIATDKQAIQWAKEVCSRGAGELLITSMNHDGAKTGFALDITAAIAGAVSIPVIASGGAGTMQHFAEVLTTGRADAALAASVFHYGEIGLPLLKRYLSEQSIAIRETHSQAYAAQL